MVLGLLNWDNILVSYLSITQHMRAQRITRDMLPYKGRFLQARAVTALFLTVLIIFPNRQWSDFTHIIPVKICYTSFLRANK
jgi:amino acid permease